MCEQMVTLPYPEIMRFLREACDGETRLYLVGGAVRDLILKRPLHDLDFVLERQVRRISRQAANAFKGDFYLLDAERNTARVLLPQENTAPLILDFAEQRGDSLLDDLTDRDFTINAIALDLLPEAPEWVDPLRGRDDLAAHVLRACSPRTFELDPLRILRAIRMQLSFGLSFAPDLEGLISGSIDQLPLVSAERARDELFKLFDSRPTDAVKSMDAMGVLAKLMPETLRMKGVEQSPPHQHDVWQHTMCMLQHLEQLIELLDSSEVGAGLGAPQREYLKVIRPYADRLRAYLEIQLSGGRNLRSMLFFAAFFHDLGKVDTQFEDEHGRIRAFGHERLSAELLDQRAERLALSNVERKFLAAVVGGHMRVHHLTEAAKLILSHRAIYRFFRDTDTAGVGLCLLSLADTLATYGDQLDDSLWARQLYVCEMLFKAYWHQNGQIVNPPRLINGNDLIQQFGLQPGPKFRHLLEAVREAQAEGSILSRDDALNLVAKIINEPDVPSVE